MTAIRQVRKSADTGRFKRSDLKAVVVSIRDGVTPPKISREPRAVTKTELVQRLADRTDLSQSDARNVIDAIFAPQDGIIAKTLKKGDRLSIAGFGTFGTRRHSVTGDRTPDMRSAKIATDKAAQFNAGKKLEKSIS